MDVRCERCKTEYEFDDERIPEAGVAVKCTACGQVFVVRKNPDPLPTSVEVPRSIPSLTAPPSVESPGEWRVRQANGGIVTLQGMSALQRSVIERSVGREDEINFTGDNWQKLGTIAELESFFRVVDEAQRAVRLSSPSADPLDPARRTTPAPGVPAADAMAEGPEQRPSAQSFENLSFRDAAPEDRRAERFESERLPPSTRAYEPAFAQADPAETFFRNDGDIAAAAGVKKRISPRAAAILGILALAAAGYLLYYFLVWLPAQKTAAPASSAVVENRPPQTEAPARPNVATPPTASPERQTSPENAIAEPARQIASPDSGSSSRPAPDESSSASASVPHASVPAAPGAGAAARREEGAKAEARSYDFYMAQADRLRERDQPAAALESYVKAMNLEPGRVEAIAGRGLALLDMGQRLKAEAWFRQALKINPRYGMALMGLAEAFRADGNAAEAIQYYEKYVEAFPDGPEAPVAREAIKTLQDNPRE